MTQFNDWNSPKPSLEGGVEFSPRYLERAVNEVYSKRWSRDTVMRIAVIAGAVGAVTFVNAKPDNILYGIGAGIAVGLVVPFIGRNTDRKLIEKEMVIDALVENSMRDYCERTGQTPPKQYCFRKQAHTLLKKGKDACVGTYQVVADMLNSSSRDRYGIKYQD